MNDPRHYAINFSRTAVGHYWHHIEWAKDRSDSTEAMNLQCGAVLVRTAIRHEEWTSEEQMASSMGVSLVKLDGVAVAQRWAIAIKHPYTDEEDGRDYPGSVNVITEYAIISRSTLRGHEHEIPALVTEDAETKQPMFRWYNADDDMPRPTAEQVHAVALHTPIPNEVDSLRRELAEMRERCRDLESTLARTEQRAAMACESPPDDCGCAGCQLAAEQEGVVHG